MRFANVVIITAAPTISVHSYEQILINSEWEVNDLIKVIPFALPFNGMTGRRRWHMCHVCSLMEGDVGEMSSGQTNVSASCASVAFQSVCFMCISCVLSCLLHVYQLRPKLSASCVSVASYFVFFMCIICVLRCLLHVYQLRPTLSASCVSLAS